MDAAQRQRPDGDGAGEHRRGEPRQESRLEVRVEAQGGLQGPRRSPLVPAPRRGNHDDRGDRQPAHHRGGRRRHAGRSRGHEDRGALDPFGAANRMPNATCKSSLPTLKNLGLKICNRGMSAM